MGRYITPVPSASQSRPIKKQQVFKTSGTFTPSQKLLDAGGVVTVRCVGGGGGGGGSGSNKYGGGSSGMDVTRIVIVTGTVTVTIGAGGYAGSKGGGTSFGTLLTASGGNQNYSIYGGASSGEGSLPGLRVFSLGTSAYSGGGGGYGGGGAVTSINGLPNTGGGGGGTQGTGGSGLCIVTWEE